MKTAWQLGSLAVLVLGMVALGAARVAADEPEAKLPLSKIVLFNSGVGFFEHDGKVKGDQTIDLRFKTEDINDLLKSMVLQDFDGGRIAPVTYGSKDPITKTLQTFAIDLTDNPTLADLLEQVRGVEVEVESASIIRGKILGVEARHKKIGDVEQEESFLNLLTDDGLRSLPLATVNRVKLLNETLDAELRQALMLLATSHSTDKKSVALSFTGAGERRVQVGYIQQAPIWKTSYRLVLTDKAPPYLQGWAIVENTTDEDWQDVALTLVSGRPISFVMNLYDPLYLSRPLVEPELFANLRPQRYDQNLEDKEVEFRKLAEKQEALAAGRPMETLSRRNAGRDAAGAVPGLASSADRFGAVELQLGDSLGGGGLGRGTVAAASGEEVGELFQYVIDTPVTLARQKSAMLPIVQGSVKGEKLSIYNPSVNPKHPLNGLRLTNTTDLHLMQGPVTVFDNGVYAGDAQIQDLQPDSTRLISYALDLKTEVSTRSQGSPDELVSARIVKGTLHVNRKQQRTVEYTVKNSGQDEKTVLIEQAQTPGWKLLEPAKPTETTRDMHRFAVLAKPGEPVKLAVKEEQQRVESVAASNLDGATIQFFVQSKAVSQAVKDALAEIVRRQTALGELQREMQQIDQELAAITQEQTRIRQNMERLDRNSELYNRYVKKFSEQEDQVEQLRERQAQLRGRLTEAQHDLDEYLMNLEVA